MSHREISRAASSLDVILREILRLTEDETDRIIEAVKDLAEQVADQEIDRLFNRGDFRQGTLTGWAKLGRVWCAYYPNSKRHSWFIDGQGVTNKRDVLTYLEGRMK